MKHFMMIGTVDVIPLQMALQRRPELWDRHRFRTTYEGTPHAEASDILLRFSPPGSAVVEVANDLLPIFYPVWRELPECHDMVFDLMRRFKGTGLGRVIVTRLAPGDKIQPHADTEGAYADSGMRFHVAVQGFPGSVFHCGCESVQMLTGQVWWFDHKALHAVENNSADDRIHLLIDVATA